MKILSSVFLTVAFVFLLGSGPAHAVGAIAVNDWEGLHPDDVGYGTAVGEHSKDAARREAIRQCRIAGNDTCKVVVNFSGCGAYAVSYHHHGSGSGASESTAINRALDQCGSSCRIVVSTCE